jgi:hypothetical protein
MWRTDFAQFDYVYTFLSPAAMERIWEKVSHEMSPGSTFITNSFPVPHPADEELAVRDERNGRLYIHRMRGELRGAKGSHLSPVASAESIGTQSWITPP